MLISTITSMATLIPMIIVWVIGLALSLSRWRRHPQVSQFALAAFVMMIGGATLVRAAYIWVPIAMRDYGWSTTQTGTIFAGIGIVSALINTAAWTFVVCAIFGWRNQSQKENFSRPAPPAAGYEPRWQGTPGAPEQ
jgi:hypothetical protein